ncbi:hypothetical protein CF319_g9358, partial [Tilletia indica]
SLDSCYRLQNLAATAAREGDGDSNDNNQAKAYIESTYDNEEDTDFEEVSFKLAEPEVIITGVRYAESVSRAKREPGAQGNPTVPSPKGADDAEEEEEGEEEEGGGQGSDEDDGQREPPRRDILPPLPAVTRRSGGVTRISSADIATPSKDIAAGSADIAAPSKPVATTAEQKVDKGKGKAKDAALTDEERSAESELTEFDESESEFEDLATSSKKNKRKSTHKSAVKSTGSSKELQSRQGAQVESSTRGASKTGHSTAGEHSAAQRLKRRLSDDESGFSDKAAQPWGNQADYKFC